MPGPPEPPIGSTHGHHGNGHGVDPEVNSHSSCPALQPSFVYFPPELWLAIFPFLSDKDLRAVTQTCSTFCYLAQPLLFRVLDVCPFFLAYNTDRLIHRPRRYLQSTLDRLEFYTSPRIAPAVNQLWISPYARSGFPPRRLTDDLDPALIISAIIDALPAFPNIRTLAWHCIDIRPSWWAAIQRLPSLTNLWVNSSAILPSTSPPVFTPHLPLARITHLDLDQWAWEGHLTNHVSIHEERLNGVDPVLLSSVIRAETIRTVSVPRHNTALHLLSSLAQVSYNTPCMLSNLTLPYSSISSEDFIPTLVQSMLLEELHILPPRDEHFHNPDLRGKLPGTCMPHIKVYDGPYHLLPIFSNTRHHEPRKLRCIGLWGLDEQISMTVCNPHQLEPILQELAHSGTASTALETISILLTHITVELLTILSYFANLRDVILESQDSLIPVRSSPPRSTTEILPESPVSALYVLLRSHTFPTSLKHLTLVTHLKTPSNLDSMTQQIDAARFLEDLGRANPQLENVDLRYGTYWTGVIDIAWRRRTFTPPTGYESRRSEFNPDWNDGHSDGDRMASPLVTSSSIPSVISTTSDASRVAVEELFALPSRPRITTVMNLHFGKMAVTEQRRAVVLPEQRLSSEETKNGVPGLRWIAGGMSWAWRLVGRVGRMIGEGIGSIQRNQY